MPVTKEAVPVPGERILISSKAFVKYLGSV